MINDYRKFVDITTNFLKKKQTNKYLFIRLLSPIRADLDYELINKIYFTKNNFYFFINNFLNLLKNYLCTLKSFFEFFKEFRLFNSIEYASPDKSSKIAFISHCDIKQQIINKIDSYYGINKNNFSKFCCPGITFYTNSSLEIQQ